MKITKGKTALHDNGIYQFLSTWSFERVYSLSVLICSVMLLIFIYVCGLSALSNRYLEPLTPAPRADRGDYSAWDKRVLESCIKDLSYSLGYDWYKYSSTVTYIYCMLFVRISSTLPLAIISSEELPPAVCCRGHETLTVTTGMRSWWSTCG